MKATFFLNGDPISDCPEGARRLVHAGLEISNHNWDHRRMVFVSLDAVAHQMEPTDAAIRDAGFKARSWFVRHTARSFSSSPGG